MGGEESRPERPVESAVATDSVTHTVHKGLVRSGVRVITLESYALPPRPMTQDCIFFFSTSLFNRYATFNLFVSVLSLSITPPPIDPSRFSSARYESFLKPPQFSQALIHV